MMSQVAGSALQAPRIRQPLQVIEHNLDVIKTPIGSSTSARKAASRRTVVVQGPPEVVAACADSHTGTYLSPFSTEPEQQYRMKIALFGTTHIKPASTT